MAEPSFVQAWATLCKGVINLRKRLIYYRRAVPILTSSGVGLIERSAEPTRQFYCVIIRQKCMKNRRGSSVSI